MTLRDKVVMQKVCVRLYVIADKLRTSKVMVLYEMEVKIKWKCVIKTADGTVSSLAFFSGGLHSH